MDMTLTCRPYALFTEGLEKLQAINPERQFDMAETAPILSGDDLLYRAALRIHDTAGHLALPAGFSAHDRKPDEPGFMTPVPAPETPPQKDATPRSVSMAQARVALRHAGLLEKIDEGLKTLPEPQRSDALIAWEYAPTVSRSGALVLSLAGVFGLDDKQLDELFAAAEKIQL